MIIQHASYLSDNGYAVTLAVQESFTDSTLAWHDKAPQLHCIPIEKARDQEYDFVIATWWKTALELGGFSARHYGYFVQSIESRFYDPAELPLRSLVESTYRLPLNYITEAGWIQRYLHDPHGQASAVVRNGIRKDIYQPCGSIANRMRPKGLRVLVEGHFGVPFKNTALSVRLAREAGVQDIWVLTGSDVKSLPWVSKVYSRIGIRDTAAVYRSCDILLKLSTVEGMFGPPLEMFHCGGTAIVLDVTGHEEYIVNNYNACVFSRCDLNGVVSTIRSLLDSPKQVDLLREGARATASCWPSWSESSAEFRNWVDSCINRNSDPVGLLRDRIRASWSDYTRDEAIRLKQNPRIKRGYFIESLIEKAPESIGSCLRRVKLLKELCLGSRVAH